MKRLQFASAASLSRLKQQVSDAWEGRDLRQCIELLQRMNRLVPGERSILLELGRMYGLIYEYNQAQEYFERAARLTPPSSRADVFAAIGQLARDFYHQKISEAFFRRAISERGATAQMYVTLAEIVERGRGLDEAKLLVEVALSKDGDCAAAILARAHLLNRAGDSEGAEAILRSLCKKNIQGEVQIRAFYELGSILDRKGSFDEAMEAFQQAKRSCSIQARGLITERRSVMKRVVQMLQYVTPQVFKKWFECKDVLPSRHRIALLGGHPRSGTTLLEQVLDSHPMVVSAEETDHFQDYAARPINRRWPTVMPILQVLDSVPNDFITTCRSEYFRVSEACVGTRLEGRLLIDKNPSQTLSVPALLRVFPEIKFLIALRDPRDVVLSCFMQPMWPLQPVNAMWLSLETAVEEYEGLMGAWKMLAPMLPNPHLEVRYEDMVNDLEPVARRVLEFLEVPWDEKVLGFDEHAKQKRVRSPTYADVTQKIFTRAKGRWRNYQKYLEPYLPKLEPFVKAFGYE